MLKSKIAGLMVVVSALLGGCASMGGTGYPSYESDLANKTIRSVVQFYEHNPSTGFLKRMGPGLLFRGTWGDEAKKYRWVPTYTHTGSHHYAGYRVPSYSLIPDQLPLLEDGDIVDVWFQEIEYDFDFNKLKSNKIVRLVCKHDDKACIKRIKTENKWGAVTGYQVPPEDLSKFTYTPNTHIAPKK